MKKLTIATPTYNEKENITELVERTRKVVEPIGVDTTLIIIDDSSPDGTGQIADQLAEKYNKSPFKISVIHRPGKMGLASAYIDAFKKAIAEKNDYILTIDADLSHKPEYIPEFLKKIKEYDLVIGSRNIPGGAVEDWSIFRKMISKGGSLYSRLILGVNVKDFTGGFNMYRKEALERVPLAKIRSEGYSFAIEIKYRVIKAGAKFCEIPIVFPNRKRGKAKMSKKIFFEAMLRVWQIRFSKI
jgi:dolichol-phosphate mannosyltransferase